MASSKAFARSSTYHGQEFPFIQSPAGVIILPKIGAPGTDLPTELVWLKCSTTTAVLQSSPELEVGMLRFGDRVHRFQSIVDVVTLKRFFIVAEDHVVGETSQRRVEMHRQLVRELGAPVLKMTTESFAVGKFRHGKSPVPGMVS